MAVSEKHPLWSAKAPDWVIVRDGYLGERHVKGKRTIYLPATSGQIEDGMDNSNQLGWKSYEAYLTRARYPGHLDWAVQTAIGMMHHNPPKIKLPTQLEYLLKKATLKNENLEQLLRRINEEQLVTGRIGLLLDLPVAPKPGEDLPYIATYNAEDMINWDSGTRTDLSDEVLNLVVLNESGYERQQNMSWKFVEKYRVLSLGPSATNEASGAYRFGLFSQEKGGLEFNESVLKPPSFRGRTLDQIPFVFINTSDLTAEPDKPPLLDLANLCLTIYRGEADYRQNLFMQGQDTLVIIGGSNGGDGETIRTGAGSNLNVPMGGDAKYIGVESDGLSEQREALGNDNKLAGSMGAQTLDTVSRERESGASLQTRLSARTANLNQIAMTGAKGLENSLKIAAVWMGLNPDDVSIIPNLDFGDTGLSGQELVELQTAKNLGAPLSGESIHQILVDKRLTVKTYEEEVAVLKKEKGGILDRQETGDQNPDNTGGKNAPPSGAKKVAPVE